VLFRRLLDLRPLLRADGALLLVLLLLVDAAILGLHLSLTLFGVPGGDHFDLGVDRSYGELLMYIKFGWIAVLAFLLAWQRRTAVFVMLGIGSLVILLEDALILHERIGWHLNEAVLGMLPALRGLGILSLQLGELLWLGLLSLVIGVGFVVAFRRADEDDRRDALSISVFFVLMAFFAVVVDTVHSFFPFGSLGDAVFTFIEDGGELVSMTPATALAFALVLRSLRSADLEGQPSTTMSSTVLSGRSPRQRA